MALPIIATIAAKAIGGTLSAQQQKSAMERQYELNEMAAENAFKRQNEMYDKDYQLHTYSAIRQQIEDAGLSAGLMYGGGGAGGISNGGTPTAPKGDVSGAAIPAMNLGIEEAANVELKEAQADYYRSLTEDKNNWISIFDTLKNIKDQEGVGLKLKNKMQEVINEYEPIIRDAEATQAQQAITEMMAKIDKLKEDIAKTKAETRALEETEELIKAQTKTESSKQGYYDANTQNLDAKTRTENAIRQYRIQLEKSNAELVDAETNLAKHRAEKVDKEIEKIGKEMNLTDAQIKEIKDARTEAWIRLGVDIGQTISSEARQWVNTVTGKAMTAAKIAKM